MTWPRCAPVGPGVGELALVLATDGASYVTGQAVHVNGGISGTKEDELIDVHTHVVPPLTYGDGGDPRWPVVSTDATGATVTVGGRPFRRVARSSFDMAVRAEEVEESTIEAQVLSPMPELFCYWAPAPAAAASCRRVNEWIAEQVKGFPGRFYGFGIVPLQDPDATVAETVACATLGLHGVMIGSNVNGLLPSDERFTGFFESAEREGLAVFVHSFHPPQASQLKPGAVASAVTFPQEIAVAMGSLIACGILDRLPLLRLGASHGGGGLALTLPRLGHVWERNAELRSRLSSPPGTYARRLYYDTLLFGAASLRFLIETAGASQVVIGSDYPFSSVAPGWPLDQLAAELGEEAVTRIKEANARAFLGLDDGQGWSRDK